MLKEIVTAIQSYARAHRFIREHKLWKWIIVPGIFYTLLFIAGFYFFWVSSSQVVSAFNHWLGIDRWVHSQRSQILSFIFLMGEIMVRLIMMLFYFSLFKYLFLIIGSPVFAYLSEKTESIMEGKDFPFSFKQLFADIVRGIKLALRNTLWQSVYTVSLLILSFIPLVGWVVPVTTVLVECYYYGFSMLDYSCERHRLSPGESIAFISKHKGLAIGNGMVFYLMHLFPIIGWVLAPAYAVVAATISLYHRDDKVGME
ncbi:MAG: EI24 domain-containing protein [Niastella sp.]|uniref:EI24 domain-containing protein n=2 Tax=Niastella sp. TaxID=1869183 RepID=UPI00389A8DA1